MTQARANPLEMLLNRLHMLGKVLSFLCCAWIAVVGTVLMDEMTPNDLQNHRSPAIQERVKNCEGEFAQRFACSQPILLNGERTGATEVLTRLALTLALPGLAWSVWASVVHRAERLLGAVRASAAAMEAARTTAAA